MIESGDKLISVCDRMPDIGQRISIITAKGECFNAEYTSHASRQELPRAKVHCVGYFEFTHWMPRNEYANRVKISELRRKFTEWCQANGMSTDRVPSTGAYMSMRTIWAWRALCQFNGVKEYE